MQKLGKWFPITKGDRDGQFEMSTKCKAQIERYVLQNKIDVKINDMVTLHGEGYKTDFVVYDLNMESVTGDPAEVPSTLIISLSDKEVRDWHVSIDEFLHLFEDQRRGGQPVNI